MNQNPTQLATAGEAYEPLTGRWSRMVAPLFLEWIDAGRNGRWLDVGCGTGALIQAILDAEEPKEVVGVDPSSAYIAYARREIRDPRVRYEVGDARALPVASNQYDAVVSGLVINVLPPSGQLSAVREMTRAARRGGTVGAYVWDYAGGLAPRALFWSVATALDPAAEELDERVQYPICQPDQLARLFQSAGLHAVETADIELEATFSDFEDYWDPFLAGYGPASAYLLSLPADAQQALRDRLRAELPAAEYEPFRLPIRAFSVRGVK
ncbi:MAG: methyltransferase domain-containing protein [Thermomicrobiales bacterium]|nr:methyltransferase domain-containing protein [Thermomicrobiales bacterium]MCO5221037.1 methyltransferase domain-containing protein [Thermomicrobiales bacterium]